MSRYESERGTIILPPAAVDSLKRALQGAANRHHAEVLAECRRLWRGPLERTTSEQLYRERLSAALLAADLPLVLVDDVSEVMGDVVSNAWRNRPGPGPTPAEAEAADVDIVALRATVRSTTFGRGQQWHIWIDGRKLDYDSGENNHQVARARREPVVVAMFEELDRLKSFGGYGRDEGGAFFTYSEYDDERFVSAAWGPLGEAEKSAITIRFG